MFAKLLKYEWQATYRLLGLLTAGVLGLGLLGSLFMVIYNNNWYKESGMTLSLFLMLGVIFGIIILGVYAAAVQFILLYRFYKNKFTDEGYLTFTLPVKTEEIYWSSVVNMLIWTIISLITVMAAIVLVTLPGIRGESLLGLIGNTFIISFEEIGYPFGIWLICLVSSVLYGFSAPLFCITFGAVLVKKHKILAAIGVYYGLNMVMGILNSILAIGSVIRTVIHSTASSDITFSAVTVPSIILTVAFSVAGYFVTIYLMKNKLNLS